MIDCRRWGFLFILLAACYNPSLQNGKQQCGPNGACPNGYQCGGDNHCYKNGQVPHLTVDMAVEVDMEMACTAMSCKNTAKPICDGKSGQCIECNSDDNCPSGKICTQSACVPGCNAMHGCPDGGGMCDVSNKMCKRCMADGDCGGGTPRCDTSTGQCTECLPVMDNCPPGKFCGQVNGVYTCQTGCPTVADCPTTDGGGKNGCCNHVCVDTDVDGTNCGGCGITCGKESCCVGICSDVTSDLANCGACGNLCAGKHATWACMASACAVTGCAAGFGDCDGDPSNGCEAVLATDVNNCNMCNNRCSAVNANMMCMGGACVIASCKPGFGNCNNMVNDGCEVNTNGDVNNCGACTMKCAPANATPACVAGKCAVASCNAGFGDCDNNPVNGCEINTTTDPKNCSACNSVCAMVPNAISGCAASKCTIASCTGGFKDCDGVVADGCESNPTSDVNNCNGCGLKCTPGVNVAAEACVNSACAITACNGGTGNCDNNVPNGCETNTTNDKNNCSKCAMVCGGNLSCVNSACVNVAATFTDSYLLNTAPTAVQCTNWTNYLATLTNNYTSVTIKGSLDGVGQTCTNSGLNEPNQLAAALHAGAAVTLNCSGRTWVVDQCGGPEITTTPACVCAAAPAYTLRPCINNLNWGGVTTVNCAAASQTITVVFQ